MQQPNGTMSINKSMQQPTAKWYIVWLAALLQLLTTKALPLLCDKDCNAGGVRHCRVRTALVWCSVVRVVDASWWLS